MKKPLVYLKSLRLSMALMVALIPVIAAGNLIPQRGRTAPWEIEKWREGYPLLSKVVDFTGLDHVYTTWWFLLLFTVLFLNMALITWALFNRTRVKARGLHRFTEEAPSYYSLGTLPPGKEPLEAVERQLKRRRYGITRVGGELYARKGWMGIWGGTVLHVGLVVILAGAVISGLFRFNGYAELGEGQGFRDKKGSYLQASYGPLFPGHRDDLIVYLENAEEIYTERMRMVLSTISIIENGGHVLTKTIRVNEPIIYKGMKVYQSRHDGPALLFTFFGPEGENTGYVNLPFRGEDRKTEKVFEFPGTPLQAKAEYMPGGDFISLEARDGREILYKGLFRAGGSLDLGQWRVRLDGINRWSGILVVYDRAVPVIFMGFWLSIAGVAIMALFDPREIWAKKAERDNGLVVEIIGWGRWRNMFMDEFQEIMEEVPGWKS